MSRRELARIARILAGACALLGTADRALAAEEPVRDLLVAGSPIAPAAADPAIAGALREISPQRIERTIETLVRFGTRNTLSSMQTDLPPGEGIRAAGDWIEGEFRRYSAACGGCLEVRRDTFTEPLGARVPRPTQITNVYAVLRGSDAAQAQRRYLVTGHYDSINSDVLDARGSAPGANDDASGVAVSLECARVLSRLRPASTLVFVAVAGEEQGLDGSRHLAALAKQEGWQLAAVLNNDIVGGDTTPGERGQDKSVVRVFSEALPAGATPEMLKVIQSAGYESDSPSRELARAMLEIARTYAVDRGPEADAAPASSAQTLLALPTLELRADRFLRGGDHLSFNEQGFAAVRLTEWRENFAHQHQNVRREQDVQYGDLPQFVDYRYVARVAALNAATLATLAVAPPAPTEVHILTRSLDNLSRLEWQGAPGVHYEILWRATAAADWQRYLSVVPGHGGWMGASVPVAKDNVIFGVRAVDQAGHRSVAVVAWPDVHAHGSS